MSNRKDVLQELEQLSNLNTIVQAYEEIAASSMRRVRRSVLQSRGFLSGLSEIFQQVKATYQTELQDLIKKKKGNKTKSTSLMQHNGKDVYVLISANTGLYGGIVRETFNLFLQQVRLASAAEITVIGKQGLAHLKEENLTLPYTYFDFPDNKFDQEALKAIVNHLVQYEKVLVYYGEFQNIVLQKPTVSSISGDELPTSENKEASHIKFFFEPSLQNIMEFFEREIVSSIFEQTMHESQLAKFASRMVSLDSSGERIKNNLKKTNLQYSRLKHATGNKRQLSSLAGISLWKGGTYGNNTWHS